ncbi:MAG: LysM peptidoglycan-binding domain-containing protein [Anaerolineae bacterium]|nr:LysM peptidoglycan-binding domain-containing protein [Anaerolineae bacterium]
MRARSWAVAVLVVLLLSAAGALGVFLFRGDEAAPAPSVAPSAESTAPPVAAVTPSAIPLPTLTPTPAPYLYTVQDGDTMFGIALAYGLTLDELVDANGLADPSLIRPGDMLVIPGLTAVPSEQPVEPTVPLPTAVPRPVLPTATPAGPPQIEISGVLGAGNLAEEVVLIRNLGGAGSLEGWTLSDATGTRFVFPRVVLFPNAELRVYSAAGQPTPLRLYWGRAEAAWTSGGLVALRDQAGETADTFIVP